MTDLTKITTPFGLLDEATQEALKAWPHGFEEWWNGDWIDHDGDMDPSNVVRAALSSREGE